MSTARHIRASIPYSIALPAVLGVAATVGLSMLPQLSVGQQTQEEPTMTEVQKLRARLQRVIAETSDDRFVEEYWKLFGEYGVTPTIWLGNTAPLAHGCVLRLDKDDRSAWAVDDALGKQQAVVQNHRYVVIRKDGIAPIRVEKEDAFFFRGDSCAMLITSDPLACTHFSLPAATKGTND